MGAAEHPPDPSQTADSAETFIIALAKLRAWCGNPSLRRLQRLAERAHPLAPTTVSWMLNGRGLPRLPRWDLVYSFVSACLHAYGYPEEGIRSEVELWRRVWRELAHGAVREVTAPVPGQLPAMPRDFTGREAELAVIDIVHGGDALIAAIVGPGGIGKTALAVCWAHRHAELFPDGQLYVDLRGFHPDRPLPADTVLAGFLSALGVRQAALPHGPEAKAGLLRTVCAGRKLLIVLDNARDSEHVRPLLPGSATCLVIVTSRDQLAGLVARDGAHRIPLAGLPDDDALALVDRILVSNRAPAGPGAARESDPAGPDLVRLCGGLPLALRIAVERAVGKRLELSELVALLKDRTRRLDVLSPPGDPLSAIRPVFEWSYEALDPQVQRLFCFLSLYPGDTWTVDAAAALADLPPAPAESELDILVSGHLVQAEKSQRYRLHDLLNAFAAERAESDTDPQARRDAIGRLLAWYRKMITGMARAISPVGYHEPSWPSDVFGSARQALEWGEAERASIRHIVETAADVQPALAAEMSVALNGFYSSVKFTHDWITVSRHGLRAALSCHNSATAARILTALGHAHLDLNLPGEAVGYLTKALPMRESAGDRRGLAVTLNGLAIAHRRQGQLQQAVECLSEALEIQRGIGDRANEAIVLNNLGNLARYQGRFDVALGHLRAALDIELGQAMQTSRCIAYCSLGEAYHAMGDYEQAVESFRLGLEGAAQLGDEWQSAILLTELGHALSRLGKTAEAQHAWRRALNIFECRDDPRAGEVRLYLDQN
ncbi:ATP-binding protein [Allorhizocola rhizosphaerae]|uniref:ATP-binding protein n=1 Tax=Allorhizocola rhizosphaerae TaxID=1872709 RepID=UPI000E3D79A6|nr:tetratricopeptide repeat protein [Allorhizocola rhizosphaerae]